MLVTQEPWTLRGHGRRRDARIGGQLIVVNRNGSLVVKDACAFLLYAEHVSIAFRWKSAPNLMEVKV
jgi:hypothetical protein